MADCPSYCVHRRDILRLSAGGVAVGTLGLSPTHAQDPPVASPDFYPEKAVGRLSQLRDGSPVPFDYPLANQPNQLFKLGAEAMRGVGPAKDIVAFSMLCTHMGGNLSGRYRHDSKALGPCPFHFSTFDLRKGGSPVHASATQNLPQVLLRLDGEEIVAYGMVGLIYGQRSNLADGSPATGTKPGTKNSARITRA